METKTAKVLNHLQKNGNITSWEAIQLYRATRLSAIIFNLRELYNIDSVWEENTNENGETTRYTRYYYGGEKECLVKE